VWERADSIEGSEMIAQRRSKDLPEKIKLPEPDGRGKLSLEETIQRRRTQRVFSQKELTQGQISQLLWAAGGVTATIDGVNFRTAPSAGATYPMEIYAITPQGLFHYVPPEHALETVIKEDIRGLLSTVTRRQGIAAKAPMSILICAVFARVTQRFGERGTMYVHMEAGHIAQNVHLQAVSLGLGSVPVGAFEDKQLKEILSLPSDQEPLYIVPVGYAE
jgi:SagB-type dehydrogenase family enzyme